MTDNAHIRWNWLNGIEDADQRKYIQRLLEKIMDWQQRMGLRADGLIGPETWVWADEKLKGLARELHSELSTANPTLSVYLFLNRMLGGGPSVDTKPSADKIADHWERESALIKIDGKYQCRRGKGLTDAEYIRQLEAVVISKHNAIAMASAFRVPPYWSEIDGNNAEPFGQDDAADLKRNLLSVNTKAFEETQRCNYTLRTNQPDATINARYFRPTGLRTHVNEPNQHTITGLYFNGNPQLTGSVDAWYFSQKYAAQMHAEFLTEHGLTGMTAEQIDDYCDTNDLTIPGIMPLPLPSLKKGDKFRIEGSGVFHVTLQGYASIDTEPTEKQSEGSSVDTKRR